MNDRGAASILAHLACLSAPRPNGKRAPDRTVDAVETWLTEHGIQAQSHTSTLHPYAMEILGLWFILGGLFLATFAAVDAPWIVLLVTFALLAIPLLETRFLQPTVTALVRRPARNLTVSFPVPAPRREVVLCAHLDSKTELLDHKRRANLLAVAPCAVVMAPAGAILFAALRQGIPAATLGSFDKELGETGLHGPLDHPCRVDSSRLVQTVDILAHLLHNLDSQVA